MLNEIRKPPAPEDHPERRINAAEVRRICGNVSDMWLWRRISDSNFPKPVFIARRRFWRERDVIAWLNEQEAAQ